MQADPKVIVALDFADPTQAMAFVDRLDPAACALKVGKEMFVVAGPEPVRRMIERGFRVFLDLKFHDIPNTVAQACAAATRLGVWMLNVHASGGEAMMRAARDAVAGFAHPPLVIGVTILTSLASSDLAAIGFAGSAAENVERLARLTQRCGLDGVVCSAEEGPRLRAACGADFKLVTPGIRLPGDAKADQARIVTPAEGVRLGADYLVIGRPITGAADPRATLAAIRAELPA